MGDTGFSLRGMILRPVDPDPGIFGHGHEQNVTECFSHLRSTTFRESSMSRQLGLKRGETWPLGRPHGPEHDCFACAELRVEQGRRPLVPQLARKRIDKSVRYLSWRQFRMGAGRTK